MQLRVLSRCSSVVAAETMFTCQLPLSLSPPLRERLFLVAERLKFEHHQDLDSKLRLEYLLCVHILHCFRLSEPLTTSRNLSADKYENLERR